MILIKWLPFAGHCLHWLFCLKHPEFSALGKDFDLWISVIFGVLHGSFTMNSVRKTLESSMGLG